MSLRRFSSLDTLTPSPNSSTKRVTVGPTTGSNKMVGTSKRARVACRSWPRSATSALSISREGAAASNSISGSPHLDDLPRPLRAARGPLTLVEPTAAGTEGELAANGSGAARAVEDSPPVSTWLEPSSRLCGAASACPEGYGPTAGAPAGASLMSLNRLITADRSTRHAGRSTATSAANADRTVSPVTTITPTSPTKVSSRTEPHRAVQACRKPPIPTPRAPPAAPSSSRPSPHPGRPWPDAAAR